MAILLENFKYISRIILIIERYEETLYILYKSIECDCLETLNKQLKEQNSIVEKKDKQIMSFEVIDVRNTWTGRKIYPFRSER